MFRTAGKIGILSSSALLLSACSGNYTWGWYVISPSLEKGRENLHFLVSGLGYTLSVALCAILLSVVLGLVMAVIALSPNRIFRTASRTYIEVLRSVPMLVMVLWTY